MMRVRDPMPLSSSSPSSVSPAAGFSVRPFDEIDLERPSQTNSGLFPVADVGPVPRSDGPQPLRRAVLLLVVVGGFGLLAYASWTRFAHGQMRASVELPAPR